MSTGLGKVAVLGRPLILLAFLFPVSGASAQQNNNDSSIPRLTLDQIVTKLEQKNAERAAALEEFEGKRIYRMQYSGFFRDGSAEMIVKVRFTAPDSKQFTVISETGSPFVIEHIFKRLLQSEQEATRSDHRDSTALTRDNYQFELAGYQNTPEGDFYILTLLPKTRNKFLYRGKIWVDARDFAVTRIEGEPGKNPSVWITKTDFEHKYRKVDDFWLPSENHTETQVRLGGKSTLSIEYQDYKILKASPLHGTENARVAPAPF